MPSYSMRSPQLLEIVEAKNAFCWPDKVRDCQKTSLARESLPARVADGLPTERGIMNGGEAAAEPDSMVFVVDDDELMLESLNNLVRSIGLRAQLFASAESSWVPSTPMCLAVSCSMCKCLG
jgi:hypothetical protein